MFGEMHENMVFFTRGSNFASDSQACQNAVYHVFEKQMIFFLELIKFYVFVLKITVLKENVLFYKVVRVIPH